MSFSISIHVDDSDFQRYMTNLMRAVPEFTEKLKAQLGPEAEDIYRSQCPVSVSRPNHPMVGGLRDSVVRMDFPDGFVVTATAPYSSMVAYGVKPHLIIAHRKHLYFWWDKIGGYFRGKQVNHPGQVQNPFHARAARLIRIRMREIVQRLVEEMVRQ